MHEIIRFSREVDLEIDYLEEFQRTKKVPQNLFYTSEGALSFYTYRHSDIQQIRWQDELDFFQRQDFWSDSTRTAFVSLGCGNAEAEKMFLHTAYEKGVPIDYFGIDSSESMLHLAIDNVQSESFPSTFILADFTIPGFVDLLTPYLQSYDVIIYAMIGGTFGNFNQACIVRQLQTILLPGSYFYLDVVPQYTTKDANAKLRDRFSHLPKNLDLFFKKLLEKLCIPVDSGEIVGVEELECDVGADRHTFYFVAAREITFPCFGGSMTVFPGEKLELLSIRAYEPSTLTYYMHEHQFEFQDTYIPDVGGLSHLWQRLLFRKDN
jgi:SAM-dependent methyltransferase